MAYGELITEEQGSGYNKLTGQFFKGHTPWNKGKTWAELKIKKRSQKRMAKGWKNLELHRCRSPYAGKNKKPIFQLDDEGNVLGWFESVSKAAEVTGTNTHNIGQVCRGKRKHAGGYVWAHEENKKEL